MNEKETIEALMAAYRYNEIGSVVCAPESKMCDAALTTTSNQNTQVAKKIQGGN